MDQAPSPLTGIHSVKLNLRAWLLKAGGIKRIHIVGCARSGTTMLHYSMLAYANTILIDEEVSAVSAPSFKESGSLCLKNLLRRSPVHLVTKRDYGWFHTGRLQPLVDCILRERIGIINIVRDPRAVLTSQIASVETRPYYVEPGRWMASITAADELFARLEGYPQKLTVRYEDLVEDPETATGTIATRFSLNLRPHVESIGKLRDNLERLAAVDRFSQHLGAIRNFDPSTIGRWRKDPRKLEYLETLRAESEIGPELQRFMGRYDYADPPGG